MISPFDMYFASTPVIAMRSTGCLRFPECPRAGGAGRMIFFKGQKAVLWTRANRDVANQDFSDHGSASYFHRVTSSKQKEAPQALGASRHSGQQFKGGAMVVYPGTRFYHIYCCRSSTSDSYLKRMSFVAT